MDVCMLCRFGGQCKTEQTPDKCFYVKTYSCSRIFEWLSKDDHDNRKIKKS